MIGKIMSLLRRTPKNDMTHENPMPRAVELEQLAHREQERTVRILLEAMEIRNMASGIWPTDMLGDRRDRGEIR